MKKTANSKVQRFVTRFVRNTKHEMQRMAAGTHSS